MPKSRKEDDNVRFPGARFAGCNLEDAGELNWRVALRVIREAGSITRVQLADAIRMSAPGVGNITRRLLDDGLIRETEKRRGGKGQPPTELEICCDALFSFGIDIDRGHVVIVLIDFAGKVLARRSVDIDTTLPTPAQRFFKQSAVLMMRDAAIEVTKLAGIGIAIRHEFGKESVRRRSSIDPWERPRLASLFANPLRLPVFVEEAVAAAIHGEVQFGMRQHRSSFFYMLVASGLEGGGVIDGSFVRGSRGFGGDFGRIGDPYGGEGDCHGSIVSRSALEARLQHGGLRVQEALSPERLSPACASVRQWVDEAANRLRHPLDAVGCLLDPAVVLVGGRLPFEVAEALAERLEIVLAGSGGSPKRASVRRAVLAEDACAIGAAILPFRRFLLPEPASLWGSGS